MTSPTTSTSRPSGSPNTSYQSPPTSASAEPARNRAASSTPGTSGSRSGSRLRCRVDRGGPLPLVQPGPLQRDRALAGQRAEEGVVAGRPPGRRTPAAASRSARRTPRGRPATRARPSVTRDRRLVGQDQLGGPGAGGDAARSRPPPGVRRRWSAPRPAPRWPAGAARCAPRCGAAPPRTRRRSVTSVTSTATPSTAPSLGAGREPLRLVVAELAGHRRGGR